VALVAAAVMVVLPDGASGPAGVEQAFAVGNQMPNDELLVHDGDRVEARGQVIVAPGQAPVLCAPVPRPVMVSERVAPSCAAQYAVTLKGFDVTKLAAAEMVQGVRVGSADVTGIWAARTIEVTAQTVPDVRSTTLELSQPADQVPCAAPAGGWKAGRVKTTQIAQFVDAHKDQVTTPRVLYPAGPTGPEVYAVGVAHGSITAVRRALTKVYDGNLCVYPAKLSETDLARIVDTASALMPKNLGIYTAGDAGTDKVSIGALVYDEALKTALAPAGLENIQLTVAVKPAR
jgi:hypothetical protein